MFDDDDDASCDDASRSSHRCDVTCKRPAEEMEKKDDDKETHTAHNVAPNQKKYSQLGVQSKT